MRAIKAMLPESQYVSKLATQLTAISLRRLKRIANYLVEIVTHCHAAIDGTGIFYAEFSVFKSVEGSFWINATLCIQSDFVERFGFVERRKQFFGRFFTGAGEGNRTLVVSLGSFCSTIELHPRSLHFTRDGKYLANL